MSIDAQYEYEYQYEYNTLRYQQMLNMNMIRLYWNMMIRLYWNMMLTVLSADIVWIFRPPHRTTHRHGH